MKILITDEKGSLNLLLQKGTYKLNNINIILKIQNMKLFFLIFSMITFSILANAQSEKIIIGTIDTINSSILNEKRPIWVYKPDNVLTRNNSDSLKQYPVVYLLDGDLHFASVVGILEHLSDNNICPEMIVVGIPNTNRLRDLTPTRDSSYSKTTGGGSDNFISFMNKELIPYIDATYPTAPYKMLIGHSIGGLTVINTLIKFSDMFNSYVAIDPSMWWDNQISLKEAKIALNNNQFGNKRLYLAIAKVKIKDMDTTSVRTDSTRSTRHIRSILELSDILNSNTDNKLNYQIKYYNNESHGTIPMIATYDALHSIFDFYKIHIDITDFANNTMALADRIENYYNVLSKNMGYSISPSESYVNRLAYSAMYVKNFPLSEYFFKRNVTNYPNSYNVYDSFGDYYLTMGNKEQAINMFKKALSIYENLGTRKKLDELNEKE